MGMLSGEGSMNEDLFFRECLQYRALLSEYFSLAVKCTLTDAEQERLDYILSEAETRALLSFLLDEVDHLVGHELGVINQEFVQQQQANLRQAIATARAEQLVMEIQGRAEELQQVLQSRGLYQGAIDGVYGPRTQEALRQLTAQERLSALVRELIDPRSWSLSPNPSLLN